MRRITILLIMCLVLATQALCQDTVKLQYKYVAGELIRYKMVMDAKLQLDMPSTGKSLTIPMRMAGVLRQRTKRVLPDGSAELSVVFESLRAQTGDQVREIPTKQMPPMTMTVSKSGQIQTANIPEINNGGFLNSNMFNSGGFAHYAVLPENELRVGDTWALAVPQIPGLAMIRGDGQLMSTNAKVGKYTTAAIRQSIGGNLTMDKPLGLPVQGNSQIPPGMKMAGAFLGDGTVYFSVDKGQLIRTDGRIDLQVNVDVPPTAGRNVGSAAATMQMTYEVYMLPPSR